MVSSTESRSERSNGIERGGYGFLFSVRAIGPKRALGWLRETGDQPKKTADQRRGIRKPRVSRGLRGAALPRLLWFWAALTAALAFAPPAGAQNATPQQPPDAPPTRRLTLHPAAEPRPALKYELLPSLLDRRPGNAAVLYNKIGLMYRGGPEFAEQTSKISEWSDSQEFPLAK